MPTLPSFPGCQVFFSRKEDGDLRILDAQGRLSNARSREAWLTKVGLRPAQVVMASGVHGRALYRAHTHDAAKALAGYDGVFTDVPGLYLGVTAADCLVLFWSCPEAKIVGIVHAGWRGLAAGILEASAEFIRSSFGREPSAWQVAIGPALGPCHFEVGEEVARQFTSYPHARREADQKIFLDLKKIAQEKLLALGVARVEIDPRCTYCEEELYFSYRRDKPRAPQVMMGVIGFEL